MEDEFYNWQPPPLDLSAGMEAERRYNSGTYRERLRAVEDVTGVDWEHLSDQDWRTNGDGGHDDDELEDWRPVDLAPALRGERPQPQPTVLCRSDHRALFYQGQVNGVHGDSGAGKGWAVLAAVKQELDAGNHVGWVDAEDPNEATIVGRLLAIGIDGAAILERFHYYNPKTPAGLLAIGLLLTDIAQWQPTMFALDSLGELFGLEGINEDKDVDVGPWLRRVARPLAEAGPAVVLVDHGTKAADNPLYPSGSKRKRAAITGASYLVETTRPLAQDKEGAVKLTCAKDRHGNYARGEHAATIEVNSYPDSGVTLNVWPPMPDEVKEADLGIMLCARDAVAAAKDEGQPLSQRSLIGLIKVKAGTDTKRAAVELAVARGNLRVETGARNTHLHTYLSDFNMTAPDCA